MQEPKTGVTRLLQDWKNGDEAACGELIALLYHELRGIAGSYLKTEREGHTLRPTALVHELYLKLAGSNPLDLKDRGHFLAISARQMRRLLVDYARQASSQKRGGIRVDLDFDLGQSPGLEGGWDPVELNAALDKLEQVDARAARVVELRFFAGLTDEETAAALEISRATVRRDWDYARAWLFAELSDTPDLHNRA
ncbi:MAG: sigma-70 family RNA polymerase sigma factor [Bryobacterales bacterium]|nr:sigma-70 family RNA polymerase sigma factor [Bryobacterales bacterium]